MGFGVPTHHLLRLVRQYVNHYNEDRPHMSLDGDAPVSRAVEPPSNGKVWLSLGLVGSITAMCGQLPDGSVPVFRHHRCASSGRLANFSWHLLDVAV
jgi:hypothetical protein